MVCMQNFRKRNLRKPDEKDKNQFAKKRKKKQIINLVEKELGDQLFYVRSGDEVVVE
jgi:hypothetical protein